MFCPQEFHFLNVSPAKIQAAIAVALYRAFNYLTGEWDLIPLRPHPRRDVITQLPGYRCGVLGHGWGSSSGISVAVIMTFVPAGKSLANTLKPGPDMKP